MDEEKKYYTFTKKFFNKFAPFYDLVVAPVSGVREKLVGFTSARKGSRILDVATGTGDQALAFAKKGYDVVGIDFSEYMLKIAEKKNKYANVKFKVADAAKLPFKNNSFDVSCISFALHEMPLAIREKTLKEMARVTKTKGLIVIVDYALPRNKISRFLVYHFVKLYEGKYYQEFIKSDLKSLLRKTGIEIEDELSVAFGIGKILKGIKKCT